MAESQIKSPPSTKPKSYSYGATATGNDRIVYPYPTGSSSYPSRRSSPRSSTYKTNPADDFDFKTTLSGRFVLKVYKASVTQLNVDVIVNAANDTMVHGGGVAKAISKAAGYALDRESKSYVDRYGPLRVAENIVTTAGELPYRAVIHAVGPMWSDYRDKVLCLDDLYDCIYNILITCKKKRFQTVAMTAISAGIFGVPKQLCADMYVYAAANFSSTLLPSECPRELHIVDVDTSILRLVNESVLRWEKDPESLNARRSMPNFLKDNPHLSRSYDSDEDHEDHEDKRSHTNQSQNFKRGRNNTSSELVTSVVKTKDERLSWGGVAKQFMVDNQIKVKVYQGDISKVRNMDTIVCGMSNTLEPQGLIADALKNMGGTVYTRSFNKMIEKHKKGHVKYSDVLKCDGGNLGAKYVLHAVINRVVDANKKETDAYQDCISSVLSEVQRNGWKTIAIPMIGTGTIQTNERKLKLCGKALLKALDEFVNIHCDQHEVKEIHLVNNKHVVDRALVEVFDEAADLQVTADSRKPEHKSDVDTSETNGHAISETNGRATGRSNGHAISRSDGHATSRSDGRAISRSDGNATSRNNGHAASRSRSDGNATSRSYGRADATQGAGYHNGYSSRSKWSYSNGKTTARNKRENNRSYYERSRNGRSQERDKMGDRYENASGSDDDESHEDELDKGQVRRRSDRKTQDGNLTIIDD
ncbi:protein mono-ADP-ribosyltransferase PARP15-like [Mercenaria mercenaria]|uniref:protein mono-ADP-ribosyltransferase PARP15-like n=1 Tax=Mercenaria mercenaria TaxID=6596 RepID=UPI00234EDDB4|nr:protein mono-ADP-ribosyltransferase PARP15-like [Mercenaria mercenaria]XP_045190459.2 protein mono-ADP-ribosyltransferase PARP15-like [Mercenaria mercenaria]